MARDNSWFPMALAFIFVGFVASLRADFGWALGLLLGTFLIILVVLLLRPKPNLNKEEDER